MNTKEYNGHTNWSTWNVALWIGNVEALYWQWKARGQELFEQAADDEGILDEPIGDEPVNSNFNTFEEAVQEASEKATRLLAAELEAEGPAHWLSITDLESEGDVDQTDWESVAQGILEEASFVTDEDREVDWTFPAPNEETE